ncbi:MAG TPA: SUMF1/EgtB/PvdO family nonheme iron enzyme, partial [Polyangiaceae bacterium]|nr:SUMF1/EgtB/PvdO family nonheme iron enzyme [Polyangiaceae bacterium]
QGDPCVSNRGPAMIQVHGGPHDAGVSFCIDSTEVTRTQYAAFLAAKPSPSAVASIRWCADKKDFVPGSLWPDGGVRTGTHPVTGVDWCDAYAFCLWAGKSLCGDLYGGEHDPTNLRESPDNDRDRWRIACTHAEDGQHAYPYGNDFKPTVCNGRDAGLNRTVPVASRKGCVGGFPGIFDMSGNANEWEDSCFSMDAGYTRDACWLRGGSYQYAPEELPCEPDDPHINNADPLFRADDLGFRCCR